MSILLPKIMKIEQKISLLGLKKYLRDESQQSLITAYIKLLENSVKISQINVKTSGYVHYINYYLKILNSMHKIHKTWRQAKITWKNRSQDSSKPEVYHNTLKLKKNLIRLIFVCKYMSQLHSCFIKVQVKQWLATKAMKMCF